MKHFKEVIHFNIPADLSMYDKLPYTINPDTKRQISLVSGNLLKYYTVNVEEEKKVIDPNDFDPDIIDSQAKDLSESQAPETYTESDEIPEDMVESSDMDSYENTSANNSASEEITE